MNNDKYNLAESLYDLADQEYGLSWPEIFMWFNLRVMWNQEWHVSNYEQIFLYFVYVCPSIPVCLFVVSFRKNQEEAISSFWNAKMITSRLKDTRTHDRQITQLVVHL